MDHSPSRAKNQVQPSFEDIISRIPDVRKTGPHDYRAPCPAHNGKNPNLHISEGTGGKVLLTCHSHHCSYADIMSAIGLGEGPASYIYRQPNGVPKFQVIRRYDDGKKSFRQYRVDPENPDAFIPGLNGMEPILFHLPELTKAVAEGKVVLIVEGEKDVLTAESLGFVATTNPGGSMKWRESYSEHLKGAHVVIVPDNDQPGRDHAAMINKSLQGVAASVKVVSLPNLPEKGDLTDWAQAGGTREQLETLIEKPPMQTFGDERKKGKLLVTTLIDVKTKKIDFLWHPYLPKGKIVFLDGDPGTGKTWLALAIAAAISRGSGLLDQEGRPTIKTEPGDVLYMSDEDEPDEVLRPRLEEMGADFSRIHDVGDLQTEDGRIEDVTLRDIDLLKEVLELKRPALFVIDPLQAYIGVKVDMNKTNEVRPILRGVSRLAAEYGTCVLIIRHLSKAQQTKDIYRGMGSMDFLARARSVLGVGMDPDDSSRHIMVHLKHNLTSKGASLAFSLRDGIFMWEGDSDVDGEKLFGTQKDSSNKIDDAMAFIIGLLENGPVPSAQVKKKARASRISEITFKRARTALSKKGIIAFETINGIAFTKKRGPNDPVNSGHSSEPYDPNTQIIDNEGEKYGIIGYHADPDEIESNTRGSLSVSSPPLGGDEPFDPDGVISPEDQGPFTTIELVDPRTPRCPSCGSSRITWGVTHGTCNECQHTL